jgi:hypothetical protein
MTGMNLGPRPDVCYCQTAADLLLYCDLTDEKTDLPFIIAADPRQRSHSWRVPRNSWQYDDSVNISRFLNNASTQSQRRCRDTWRVQPLLCSARSRRMCDEVIQWWSGDTDCVLCGSAPMLYHSTGRVLFSEFINLRPCLEWCWHYWALKL